MTQPTSDLDDLIDRLDHAIRPRVITINRKRAEDEWVFDELRELIEKTRDSATAPLVHRATRLRNQHTTAHDLFARIEHELAGVPGRHVVEQRALIDEAGAALMELLSANAPALRHAEALEALDEDDLAEDDAVCLTDRINNRQQRLEALEAAMVAGSDPISQNPGDSQ